MPLRSDSFMVIPRACHVRALRSRPWSEFLYTHSMNDRSLNDNELTRHRIAVASGLFAAWSAGDADAPEPFWAPDGVLEDVASGTFEGWPAIRAFFANGLTRTANLSLDPRRVLGQRRRARGAVRDERRRGASPRRSARSTSGAGGRFRSCRTSASTVTVSATRPTSTTRAPAPSRSGSAPEVGGDHARSAHPCRSRTPSPT